MPRKKAPPRRNDAAGVEASPSPAAPRGKKRPRERVGARPAPADAPLEARAVARLVPRDAAPRVVARLTGTAAARDAPARPDTPTEPRARAAFVRFEASPDGRELRWRFVTSDDAPDAADSPIDPDAASVAPATAAASSFSSSSTSWLADRPPGAPETARAFVELVRGGELAIAAEEVNAESSSSSSSSLLVALADAAFRHPPTHPEEWSRRRAHARLRAALAWLAPPDSRVDRIAAGIEAIAPPSLAATDEIRGGEETIPNAATEKEGSLTAGGPSPKAPKTDPKTAPKTRTAALDDAIRGVYDAARPPPPPPPPRAGESRDARSPAQKSFLPRDFPELRPTPRGYQRRAVEWMIRREKGGAAAETKRGERASDDDVGDDDVGYGWFAGSGRGAAATHPLWRPLRRLGDPLRVGADENAASSASSVSPPPAAYVNWHTGQVSLEAFGASEDVRGGVLADEMGLGKTVELLMCVLAHRFPRGDSFEEERPNAKTDDAKGSEPAAAFAPKGEARDAAPEAKNPSIIGDAVGGGDEEKGLGSEAAAAAGAASRDSAASESEGEEVVGCACGDQDANYDGMWLACDDCGEWSHARCVGYTKADERRLAAAHEEEEKNKTTREVGDGENKLAFFEPPAFTCGRCAARRAGASFSGPCGATLVVCPSPILEQWRSELARHAAPGALRVATYEGQPRDFGGPGGWRLGTRRGPAPVSAAELAAADVVLTTYETLRRDIHRDPGGPGAEEDDETGRGGGRRRGRRRYEPLPTPLTRLRWWRVVLDEAQEVESSTAKAAEMARLIPGVNRWCVTGTPVSRGLEDLQGLFAFLGAPSPLTDAGWFRRVAKAPYDAGVPEARDAMHAVARRMMWRHARRDVEDELGLPPQSQIVTRLSASGIEAHWYARQRRVCAGAAREALRRVREARAGAKKRAPAAILRGDDEDAETDEDAREERRSRTPAWARAGVGRRLGGGDGSRERGGEEDERGDEEEGEDDRDEREARSDERGVDEEGDATAATAGSERVVVDDAPSAVDLTSDARASAADKKADDLRALTPEESRRVLLPLLRLRQACNHPQAGAHGVRGVARGGGGGGARRSRDAASFVGAGGVHHGAIMTMPEIHAVLIEKQRIEAEEAQRLVAFARNASAGVATCLGGAENRRVAVEHYREVLRLDAAGATDGLGLRLDALQRLHALHNLKLALDAVDEEEAAFKIRHSESETTPGEKTAVPYRGAVPAPLASPFAGVSRTLRDASLESDAALVRAEYLAKRAGGVGAALAAFRDAVKATNDARLRSGATGPGPSGATWWFAVLDREARRAPNNTNAANNPNAFVDRLARGALGGSWQGRAVAFTDAAGLRFQLESDLARVGSMREAFLERVRTLTERTEKADPADVDAAGRCQVCVSLDGGGDGGGAAFGGVSRANRAGVVRAARVVCRHCVAEAENAEYEDVVFGKQSDAAELYGNARGRVARGDVGAGRSAPSSAETALRVLATKCQDDRDIYMASDTSGAAALDTSGSAGLGVRARKLKSEAAAHLETMEGIRREFRCASTLLKRQSLELKARDELAMATTRIRVRAAHEVALGGVPDPVPEHLRASVVHDWELDDLARGYELDRATYEADLRKAASQVRFLERLRSEDQTNGGAEEEEEEEEDLEEEEDAEGGKAEERGGEDVAPRRKKSSEVAPRRKKRAALREAKTFECPVCQEDVDGSASAAQLAVLPCGHRLCVACTDALVARAPAPPPRRPRRFKCPTCREPADADEVNYVSFGSKKPRVRREHPRGDGDPPGGGSSSTTGLELEKAAAAALSSAIGTPEEHERGEALLAVRGSWGTKIEAVTRRVLWLLDPARPGADAATKVLVFSEWEDALRVVCAALRANGVDAEHPAGGGRKLRDAIQRFKRGENRPSASSANGTERGGAFDEDEKDEEDGADGEEKARRRGLPGASEAITPEARASSDAVPESPPAPRAPLLPPPPSSAPPGPGPGRVARSGPRALLLPLRRGANGLNLTEAQHVILLEPVLDHGAEAQATKRVDRIGQTRPTCVHRFLLQGTVEENVQALSNRRKEAARSAAGSARGAAAKGITVAEAEMLIPRAGG